MSINGHTKKTPEFELAAEVVRAAFLARDWVSRAISGAAPALSSVHEGQGFVPPELVRLCKAVDALRTLRGTQARAKRRRNPQCNPGHG